MHRRTPPGHGAPSFRRPSGGRATAPSTADQASSRWPARRGRPSICRCARSAGQSALPAPFHPAAREVRPGPPPPRWCPDRSASRAQGKGCRPTPSGPLAASGGAPSMAFTTGGSRRRGRGCASGAPPPSPAERCATARGRGWIGSGWAARGATRGCVAPAMRRRWPVSPGRPFCRRRRIWTRAGARRATGRRRRGWCLSRATARSPPTPCCKSVTRIVRAAASPPTGRETAPASPTRSAHHAPCRKRPPRSVGGWWRPAGRMRTRVLGPAPRTTRAMAPRPRRTAAPPPFWRWRGAACALPPHASPKVEGGVSLWPAPKASTPTLCTTAAATAAAAAVRARCRVCWASRPAPAPRASFAAPLWRQPPPPSSSAGRAGTSSARSARSGRPSAPAPRRGRPRHARAAWGQGWGRCYRCHLRTMRPAHRSAARASRPPWRWGVMMLTLRGGTMTPSAF